MSPFVSPRLIPKLAESFHTIDDIVSYVPLSGNAVC
jgi:hypothetical protein